MGDNSIDCEDWEDGEALASDKKTTLNTAPSSKVPPLASSRGVAIVSGLIDEHKHVWVGHNVCNAVHICSLECLITFQGLCGDTLSVEVKALECA